MSWVSESRIKRKLVFSNEENKKKKASVSVWSEEDDISLLKGVADYEALNQSSPYADMGKFLDSVKPSLHFDVQRKQLTDRLWRLKKRFLDSNYDLSKPHHAKLFELAKSIKAWGNHASVSLDGDKSVENVSVTGDDRNGKKDDVVVGGVDVSKVVQNKDKGKLGTGDVRIGKKDNLVVGDVHVDKLVQNKGKGKLGTSDVWNGEKVNVVVGDVDVDKSSKLVKTKEKRKLVTGDVRSGEKVNVAINDDVRVNKGFEVVKKKRKLVSRDGQNVKEAGVVLDDVNGAERSKVVKSKKKGKVVTCDGQNDKDVVVVAVDPGRSEQVVKDKNKGNIVTLDDQNVEEYTVLVEDVDAGKSEQVVNDKNKGNVEDDNVAVDEIDGDDSNSAQVVKDMNKEKVAISDGQTVKEDHVVVDEVHGGKSDQVVKDKVGEVVISAGLKNTMVVDDVDGSKCLKVVKDKKTRKVVISDDQNAEDDNAVVDDFQSAKKNGKKRVKVLGDENGLREVNRKDLEYCTSKYPKLMNMLELETLSSMPQHIKKNCVIDTIKYMGRGKANKLEEKWADLLLLELELHAKKLDLRTKQINLILEAARR